MLVLMKTSVNTDTAIDELAPLPAKKDDTSMRRGLAFLRIIGLIIATVSAVAYLTLDVKHHAVLAIIALCMLFLTARGLYYISAYVTLLIWRNPWVPFSRKFLLIPSGIVRLYFSGVAYHDVIERAPRVDTEMQRFREYVRIAAKFSPELEQEVRDLAARHRPEEARMRLNQAIEARKRRVHQLKQLKERSTALHCQDLVAASLKRGDVTGAESLLHEANNLLMSAQALEIEGQVIQLIKANDFGQAHLLIEETKQRRFKNRDIEELKRRISAAPAERHAELNRLLAELESLAFNTREYRKARYPLEQALKA